MLIRIIKRSTNAQRIIKSMQDKCNKKMQISYDNFAERCKLDNTRYWNIAMNLFYMIGLQRYTGSCHGQDELTTCTRGAKRFIEILSNYGQNYDLGYALHGPSTTEIMIEVYYTVFDCDELAYLLEHWNKLLILWNYNASIIGNSSREFQKIAIRPITGCQKVFPGSRKAVNVLREK